MESQINLVEALAFQPNPIYYVNMLANHIFHASGRAKTVCTSAVLGHFGVGPSEYHYSGHQGDIERILRAKGFSVRSRRSQLPKKCSVGKARERIAKFSEPGAFYYISVPGHAMLVNGNGETVVDTDPRVRDRRQVLRIFQVAPRRD